MAWYNIYERSSIINSNLSCMHSLSRVFLQLTMINAVIKAYVAEEIKCAAVLLKIVKYLSQVLHFVIMSLLSLP